MTSLRALVVVLGVLVSASAAEAQPAGKVPRIGFLTGNAPESSARALELFRQALREHGYIDGQNVKIEPRYADGNVDRLPQLAKELVSLKVDVLVAPSRAAPAAKAATTEIPIVFYAVSDPVGQGLVASLARPGGNITGFTDYRVELTGKRLALLKEALPRARRLAVLSNQASAASNASAFKEAETAARALNLGLRVLHVQGAEGFGRALETAKRDGASAVLMVPDPFLFTHRGRIAELARGNGLPLMGWRKEVAEAGALLSYGVKDREVAPLVAGYVARILKGEKPGDLPVQQPTKLELILNAKTAKALGLTIPQSVVLIADEVIR